MKSLNFSSELCSMKGSQRFTEPALNLFDSALLIPAELLPIAADAPMRRITQISTMLSCWWRGGGPWGEGGREGGPSVV